MAQTITRLKEAEAGGLSKMKLVALNVANGAGETSIAVNYQAYGLGTVLLYGHVNKDTFTNASQFDNLVGTTVTHTWTAADVANVLVWALGY